MQKCFEAVSRFCATPRVLRRGRPYEQAVKLFFPYSDIQDPNPEVRASLRELIDRARKPPGRVHLCQQSVGRQRPSNHHGIVDQHY